MKTRRIQIITICMLLCLTVLCIPASYSKYATSYGYTINVKMNPEKAPDKVLWVFPGETSPLKAPATGYYVIIAKGGDGADCFEREESHDFFTKKGGTGGSVIATVKLNKDDLLYAYPGTDGNRPSTADNAVLGTGGVNGKNLCNGGSGDDTLDGSADYLGLADSLSETMASGGGGAASLVFLNGQNNTNILVIAGGGGGAGCQDNGSWAAGATVKSAHNGGNGGGNISSSTSYVSQSYPGTVYPGGDANGGEFGDSKWGTAIGYGGSKNAYNEVGAGGTTKYITWLAGTVPNGTGGNGNYIDSNGYGGTSDQYGGGGGGGFCGGGAGTGTSLNTGAGGGGGGSSFVAATANGVSISTSASKYSSILSEASSKIPTQKGNTYSDKYTWKEWKIYRYVEKSLTKNSYRDYGDGYVIVKYIGKTLT